MSKSIAFLMGFIMIMLPLASAGIVYDEETREVSEIAANHQLDHNSSSA